MHSIFLSRTELSRIDTTLCFIPGLRLFNDGRLVVNEDIHTIATACLDEYYIGPGGTLVFKGFIRLAPRSITSPLITDIVFEQDAEISEDAFFSETVNSNLYKNYTLYCRKDSEVEKFAEEHGFDFRDIADYPKRRVDGFECWVCGYDNNITIEAKNHRLDINEDRFVFSKRSEKRNGDYLFVQSPYVRDSFKSQVANFIQAFLSMSTQEEKDECAGSQGRQLFLTIALNAKNSNHYLAALRNAFKDSEIEDYLDYFIEETE